MDQFYNAEVAQYPYDPEMSATLLDQAGWTLGDGDIRQKDGEDLTFVCTTISGDQTRRPEAELVQQYLREVGIDMQLEEAPVATILEQMRAGTMDASLYNWTYGGDDADPDASVTLRSDGTNNFSHFNNPRVDELLDAGIQEIDPAARSLIYQEIQQIVADEVPFLFMMFWNIYTIFSTRIQGLPESALSSDQIYAKANQFWVAE
jgi:peptide/nickel transport system substrate-binding protein